MHLHTLAPFALSFPLALPQDSSFLSKREVELPVERALAPLAAPSNRPVAPGLVTWHADLAAACAAAERSGKPVLLFQLLGRLDEELC
ncbi:MAG TPA: hypothetical protein VF530_07510 [Planctomycetota bacterium]